MEQNECMFLQSVGIYQQPPYKSYPEYDKNKSIDPVNDMNVVRSKPVADLACQHYFGSITCQHKTKTDTEDGQSFLYCMTDKCSGGSKPEKKYGRSQGIHQKSRQEYSYIISFPELNEYLLALFIHFYFFKKQEINTHYHQKYTACNTDLCTVTADACK